MVTILKIKNEELKTTADFNEIILLDCIKLCHHRNTKLKERLIDIYEQCFQEKFSEEKLNY